MKLPVVAAVPFAIVLVAIIFAFDNIPHFSLIGLPTLFLFGLWVGRQWSGQTLIRYALAGAIVSIVTWLVFLVGLNLKYPGLLSVSNYFISFVRLALCGALLYTGGEFFGSKLVAGDREPVNSAVLASYLSLAGAIIGLLTAFIK